MDINRETYFWTIIEKASLVDSTEDKYAVLTKELNNLPKQALLGFEHFVRSKIGALFNSNTLSLMKLVFPLPSIDDFVGFAGWILLRGKDFYERMLSDLDNISDVIESNSIYSMLFEDISMITDNIYEKRLNLSDEDMENNIMPSDLGEFIFDYHSISLQNIEGKILENKNELTQKFPKTAAILNS